MNTQIINLDSPNKRNHLKRYSVYSKNSMHSNDAVFTSLKSKLIVRIPSTQMMPFPQVHPLEKRIKRCRSILPRMHHLIKRCRLYGSC